jgi:hypothetical protein
VQQRDVVSAGRVAGVEFRDGANVEIDIALLCEERVGFLG